jgi:hypothetical protein
MSLSQIEAELEHLTADELRRLALKSWAAFIQKEGFDPAVTDCSEDDPDVLTALDAAVRQADTNPGAGCTGTEVLAKIRQWTTK